MYSAYAAPPSSPSSRVVMDSIFAVSAFAVRQSFLYRQSSQSKKMTLCLARAREDPRSAGTGAAEGTATSSSCGDDVGTSARAADVDVSRATSGRRGRVGDGALAVDAAVDDGPVTAVMRRGVRTRRRRRGNIKGIEK